MMKKISIFIAFASCFFSCQKYYISIAQEKIDKDFLASTHVRTPDSRQKNPPLGDRLILEWQVPRGLLHEDPLFQLHVIYKDYTEQFFTYPILHRTDYAVYTLEGEEYLEKKGILTYEAKILTNKDAVFREWKHQLFVQLIQIDQDELSTVD